MRILVLGASGMLGSAVFRLLAATPGLDVTGTVRDAGRVAAWPEALQAALLADVDALDEEGLADTLERTHPDVVINCVGLIKQLAAASDPLQALPVNALLPHRLARLAALSGARVVHVSTDCVFAGRKGGYRESDVPDAEDLYGKSKQLGELLDYPHAVTLRTSIIGHELDTQLALVDWFLAQSGSVRGYTQAIFSGLPTVELATVIRDHVLPRRELHGLYHVSADPIDKCSLLRLIAEVYGKAIEIVPDDSVAIDRSLDSTRFRATTGYCPPAWPELVRRMHAAR
ncbi:MAG: rfbD1 [Moraxellaceae bacterium]|jgi:dTDP-4-dehydrorhamnose reductase|nr:rfbD1 [Moraxellaceae bacterium]